MPQFASGRGELASETPLDLSEYSIQLICPAVHVSTSVAFSLIKPKPAAYDLRQLYQLPITEWKLNISNDFEQAVFLQHPRLADIKQQLYDQGAIYASMSGSGSAIYGIFEKGCKAEIKSDIRFELSYLE
jgi:4-diphosphocytidyl-2-C-methyl-D-erythritol kinase